MVLVVVVSFFVAIAIASQFWGVDSRVDGAKWL